MISLHGSNPTYRILPDNIVTYPLRFYLGINADDGADLNEVFFWTLLSHDLLHCRRHQLTCQAFPILTHRGTRTTPELWFYLQGQERLGPLHLVLDVGSG